MRNNKDKALPTYVYPGLIPSVTVRTAANDDVATTLFTRGALSLTALSKLSIPLIAGNNKQARATERSSGFSDPDKTAGCGFAESAAFWRRARIFQRKLEPQEDAGSRH